MIPGETLFVDTNILIYSTNNLSVWHLPAERMLDSARLQGISLIISPQIIREYISVFTRNPRYSKIKTDGLRRISIYYEPVSSSWMRIEFSYSI